MTIPHILAGAAAVCVAWYVVTSIRIYEALRRRNIRVRFLWLRAMAPVYAHRYKKITTAETGKSGSLFYQWIISINLALVLAVAAILIIVA